MKNLNFRQEWHEQIRTLAPDNQIEVYNALFYYNTTGEMPDGLSDAATELIDRLILPVLKQRKKAAEYRRRKAAGKPAQKPRKNQTTAIPLLSAPQHPAAKAASQPEVVPKTDTSPKEKPRLGPADYADFFEFPLNRNQRRLLERLCRKRPGGRLNNRDLDRITRANPSMGS